MLTMLSLAGEGSAQSQHIEARIRSQQARAAALRSEFDEAIRLYRESIALEPMPPVVRDLARLLEERGRYRASAEAWIQFATTALRQDDRDHAIERSEYLRRMGSILRVRVAPFAAARLARVWFDHDPPRVVPAGGAESMVEGGAHRVRVESPGFQPFERMVTTGYGEPLEVIAVLRPVGEAPPPAPGTDASTSSARTDAAIDSRRP
jgi:hypothetical protein